MTPNQRKSHALALAKNPLLSEVLQAAKASAMGTLTTTFDTAALLDARHRLAAVQEVESAINSAVVRADIETTGEQS